MVRAMSMLRFTMWLVLVGAPLAAHGQTTACDTGLAADCDGDGFSIADGDCDDTRERVHPGQPEKCDDELDNDCDGFYDEGCAQAARQGGIRGGGGCTGGQAIGSSQVVVLLPLFGLGLFGRRRREA